MKSVHVKCSVQLNLFFDYNALMRLDRALSRMDKDYICSDGINHYEVLKQKREDYIRGKAVIYDATFLLKSAIAFCGSLIPNINETHKGDLIKPRPLKAMYTFTYT